MLAVFSAVAVAALAQGPTLDARGWKPGQTASNAGRVIAELADEEMPQIEVPKLLSTHIDRPTVVFYFSPTCPHCTAVAAEVAQLQKRLDEAGAKLVWVASASATEAERLDFAVTYGVQGGIVHDIDREIVAAIGARSTPSALLLEPAKKGKVAVRDVWYPYVAGFDGLIEARVRKDPFGVFREGEYQGNNHCGACHTVEHQSWSLTHHSIAWRTLQRKSATSDPACTGCHVTGNEEPTGWDGDPQSHLTDVGCESCHGPGGPHDGTRTDPRQTCAACHDDKHSIAFSVEKGMPLIDHFAADHLSEADYDAQRRLLWKGEAPRALLAFPEGEQVGAAACISCHAEQHAIWVDGPHARAMSSLEKDDKRTDPECVKCHATAKRSGPPPAESTSFHTGDGVGCESCHGPGDRHVENPSKANIEGLGEDCPVCVIEAVCTGCHTATWDPTWDLDEKLPKVHH